jgi:cytochrome b subunit of formate dehydrogenase
MGLIQWGHTPWGQPVPIHIGWYLIWVSLFLGVAAMAAHALWTALRSGQQVVSPAVEPEAAAGVPAKVPRHSLAARLFHWVMAGAMLTLLATAFLPRVGWRFDWVNLHWMAGIVLIAAVILHLVHGVFFMDFWSIWPGPRDLKRMARGLSRALGSSAPAAGKPGKYPPANQLYHLIITICGLTMAVTGLLLLFRIRTPFLTRNPYILSDNAWAVVYLLHGFAGVALIGLVAIHVYFALRPDKWPVTRAMISGTMDREYVLSQHDPRLWGGEQQRSK